MTISHNTLDILKRTRSQDEVAERIMEQTEFLEGDKRRSKDKESLQSERDKTQAFEDSYSQEEANVQDKKFISMVERFHEQIKLLLSNLKTKEQRGLKIYSVGQVNLFSKLGGQNDFERFLRFLDEARNVPDDSDYRELPSMPSNLLRVLDTSTKEDVATIENKLNTAIKDAKELATKRYGTRDGLEVLVIAFERRHDATFRTSSVRRGRASAFAKLSRFLRTGKKQISSNLEKSIAEIYKMNSEIEDAFENLTDAQKIIKEKFSRENYSRFLIQNLNKEIAIAVSKPQDEIKEFIAKLPDSTINAMKQEYTKTVIPKVKEELEALKAGKRATLIDANTQAMKEKLDRALEELRAEQAKLVTVESDTYERLQATIAEQRKKVEEFLAKNPARGKNPETKTRQSRAEKIERIEAEAEAKIREAQKELSNIPKMTQEERNAINKNIRALMKVFNAAKLAYNLRVKNVGKRTDTANRISELEAMLDVENYNKEHLKLLRNEIITTQVMENIDELIEDKTSKFREMIEESRRVTNQYGLVASSIAELLTTVNDLRIISNDIDEYNKTIEKEEGERKNAYIVARKEAKKPIFSFIRCAEDVKDIRDKTLDIESLFEDASESISLTTLEVINELSRANLIQGVTKEIEDAEEDLEKVLTEEEKIREEVKSLNENIVKLKETTKNKEYSKKLSTALRMNPVEQYSPPDFITQRKDPRIPDNAPRGETE